MSNGQVKRRRSFATPKALRVVLLLVSFFAHRRYYFRAVVGTALSLLSSTESQSHDIVAECSTHAKSGESSSSKNFMLRDFVQCAESRVADAIEQINQRITSEIERATRLAATLENYTCLDDSLSSTDDIATTVWTDRAAAAVAAATSATSSAVASSSSEARAHVVHVKFDRPASRIHVRRIANQGETMPCWVVHNLNLMCVTDFCFL